MMKEGFDETHERIEKMETKVDEFRVDFDEFREETNANFLEVRGQLRMIEKRLDLLEEQGASNAGFAKEIDGLRADVAAIKKFIKLPAQAAA
jgi:Tfp pilus assembly protein PilO